MNKIFDGRKISTFRDFKDLVRSNKLIGRREICIVVDRLELENVVYKAEEYDTIKKEKDKEIERLNNIIKNLDKMFEYYFLGNLKYDQDTVNAIYIKYIKLKELKEGR